MTNELNEKQKIALQSVVDSISNALESGVGVAALGFAIENHNCGLIDLMSKVVERMYHDPRGLLRERCLQAGAEKVAEGASLSLDSYLDVLQQDAQQEYRV